MAKKFKQMYKKGKDDIYFDFFKNCIPNGSNVYSIGIQTFPGVKFYINPATDAINDAIMVGSSGIYQFDLDDYTVIQSLYFDAASINELKKENNGFFIILDIVYEQ